MREDIMMPDTLCIKCGERKAEEMAGYYLSIENVDFAMRMLVRVSAEYKPTFPLYDVDNKPTNDAFCVECFNVMVGDEIKRVIHDRVKEYFQNDPWLNRHIQSSKNLAAFEADDDE